MDLTNLHLHPNQYLKLNEPLKIYINDKISQDDFETIHQSLSKRKTPLVLTGKPKRSKNGGWNFYLQMPSFSLLVNETDIDRRNLQCNAFNPAKNGKNGQYYNRFSRMFLMEAAKGIYFIYKRNVYFIPAPGESTDALPDDQNTWNMSLKGYQAMLTKMYEFFDGEDEYVRSEHVSDNMNDNVMFPFDQYTEKEHEYETRKVDFTKGILYTKREIGAVSKGKKSTFHFVSNDKNADPEKCTLAAGQLVVIYREDQTPTSLIGLLVDVDNEAEDGIRFLLEFYQQFDLDQLPESGYLFVYQNDTQRKIRKAVSKSIRSGRSPAKYMYKTFHDFSVQGYEKLESHPDLIPFLHNRMGLQYPPNKMQLEAIVKGILTDDILLVLGPPGTGKTTVILSWVEYFVSQGKRVLISSQNNAAVDNVLERLTCGDIVRLGREEKIQENCKIYLPANRIELMRSSCASNGQRLESQLESESKQINTYIAALEHFLDQHKQLQDQKESLARVCLPVKGYIKTIQTCHQDIVSARDLLEKARSASARYQIFIEESMQKNVLVRFLQAGLRLRAKNKIKSLQADIDKNEALLAEKQQAYEQAVQNLAAQIRHLRSMNLLEDIQATKERIQLLNRSIFFGDDKTPALVPKFESELKFLDLLTNRPSFAQSEMENTHIAVREIETMKQVKLSAEKLLSASRHWVQTALKDDRNDIFEEILLEACQVVGATCIGINSNKKFANVDFDVTIIDESGQIQLHNALVPMSRSPKTLMLGDYKQIPPIVNNEIAKSCQLDGIPTHLFEQSFFEFLFEQMRQKQIKNRSEHFKNNLPKEELPEDPEEATKHCIELAKKSILKPVADSYIEKPLEKEIVTSEGKTKTIYSSRYNPTEVAQFIQQITADPKKIVNLNTQFRMPGNISDVISEWFYERNYFSSYNMAAFHPVVPNTTLPMVVINTAGNRDRFESQPENKMGYQNITEAELVADIMEAVLARMDDNKKEVYRSLLHKRLGIISAYGAQVRCIRQALKDRLDFTNAEANTAVASLDSFQGQERDLIIYSLTRSGQKPSTAARVGFLKELRRLNVAFTRCKKQLVIIGDLDYLQTCLYLEKSADTANLPCANTSDDVITKIQINQCADCKYDCERRFSRFFRLLMQHVKSDSPAGNLLSVAELKNLLKGDPTDAP